MGGLLLLFGTGCRDEPYGRAASGTPNADVGDTPTRSGSGTVAAGAEPLDGVQREVVGRFRFHVDVSDPDAPKVDVRRALDPALEASGAQANVSVVSDVSLAGPGTWDADNRRLWAGVRITNNSGVDFDEPRMEVTAVSEPTVVAELVHGGNGAGGSNPAWYGFADIERSGGANAASARQCVQFYDPNVLNFDFTVDVTANVNASPGQVVPDYDDDRYNSEALPQAAAGDCDDDPAQCGAHCKPAGAVGGDVCDGLVGEGRGPLVWWRMDESSGRLVPDSSANDYQLSLSVGSTLLTPGAPATPSGGRLRVGTTEFGRAGAPTAFDFDEAFTVQAYVRADPIAGDVIAKGGGWGLRLDGSGLVNAVINGSTLAQSTTPIGSAWRHVAMAWDGATVRVYVDGTEEGSGAAPTAPVSAGQQLVVGLGLSGEIDEAKVFDYARTGAQIAADLTAFCTDTVAMPGSVLAQTCGGGRFASSNYQAWLSVGAPRRLSGGSSATYRLRLGAPPPR